MINPKKVTSVGRDPVDSGRKVLRGGWILTCIATRTRRQTAPTPQNLHGGQKGPVVQPQKKSQSSQEGVPIVSHLRSFVHSFIIVFTHDFV